MNGHTDGEDLTARLDGELDADARARVEAHLAACDGCRAEADSLRHLKAALACAPRRRMPADLALALEARRSAAAAPAAGSGPRALLWASAGALAAAAVLAARPWSRGVEDIPLEPLLTAHARYSAESPLAGAELAASRYSSQLEHLLGEPEDLE